MPSCVDISLQMILGLGSRRPRARNALALGAACVLVSSPTAAAMSSSDADLGLSPTLAELARPAVRALPSTEQAAVLDVAVSGPGSLLRDEGRVLVDVRFDRGAIAALPGLRAAGAEVLASSQRYQTVSVAIGPGRLRQLAAVPGVEGVRENRAPLVFDAGLPAAAALGAECEGGSVISEGVAQLQVAEARSKYAVDGGGLTVGVLSDSYDQATGTATDAGDDVASGDLPGLANPCGAETSSVNVLADFAGAEASDEGRAMLQIIHDIAPAVELAFATAFVSETSFAQNIEALASPGEGGADADVIVDDVAWLEEPFFQDGPVAVAVDKVAAEGTSYFSSAGNNNLFEGSKEIASWEAPAFRDSLSCPPAVQALLSPGAGHCMDFDPSLAVTDDTFGITVSPGATLTLDLQWAEPWFGVETDLDAYLLNATGSVVAASEDNNVALANQRPVELLQWENASGTSKTVRLAINRCAAVCNPAASPLATPTLKFALLQNGGGVTATEYPSSLEGDTVGPTIFGHAAASGAVAVAAIHYASSIQPEKFSSRGPVVHHFEPVNSTTAAAPLGSPETIQKPEITATDCGENTFFGFYAGGEDAWRFCGTSAAAPHAAAVAALQLDLAESPLTADEVRDAQTATATAIGGFGPNAVGAGLLDAEGALASLLPPSAVTITAHPSSRTADSTPSFDFESTPPTANFECSLDGGPPQLCTSPYTVPSPLADGTHLFEVSGVEVAGSASFSFTVDTTPPAIAFNNPPPAIGSNPSPTIAFTVKEPAEVTCSIDGLLTKHCHSPVALSVLADGRHRFEVTAVDQVGNSGQAAIELTVDTAAPSLTLTETPPPKSANHRPTFGFVANEPVAFACSIDGEAAQPCASPFVVPSPLADGEHGFGVVATDLAGNVVTAVASFAIDTRAPRTFFASAPRRTIVTRKARARVTFRFGADEPGVSFACKVDRGLLRLCPARISRRFAPGAHTVRVKAQDEVGNVDRTAAVFRFRVKRIG
jgi:hypothetical protein